MLKIGSCRCFNFFSVMIVTLLLLNFNYAKASNGDVIINEINWAGSSVTSSVSYTDDWVELKNQTSSDINLSGWVLENAGPTRAGVKTSVTIPNDDEKSKILANNYYLISRYGLIDNTESSTKTNLSIEPDLRTQGETNYLSLNNSANGDLVLKDSLGNIIDEAEGDTWPAGDSTNRYSMERNDVAGEGLLSENWHTAGKETNLKSVGKDRGTPKSSNYKAPNLPPELFKLVSPVNNSEILDDGQSINFSWEASADPEKKIVSYDFYLGCEDSFSASNLIDSGFEEINFDLESIHDFASCEKYFWKIVATDGISYVESSASEFNLIKPVYSEEIIVNEIMPHPMTDETNDEWIELYNNSDQDVNLSGWKLEDERGAVKSYVIGDVNIKAFDYVVFYRSQTKIVLNNDADGVKLIHPDDNVIFETPIFTNGDNGWSWARKSNGNWDWTTKETPDSLNIVNVPIEEEKIVKNEEEIVEPPIETKPVRIQSGDYKNYENQIIEVVGEVVETRGSSIWVDDGTGAVKFYIQPSRNIEKPLIHAQDIVQMAGLVDYFRNAWRVLIRRQEDVKVLEYFKKETSIGMDESLIIKKTSSVKKNAIINLIPKVMAAESVVGPRPPNKIVESVVSGQIQEKDVMPISGGLIQFAKMLTGLAVTFLVLLVIKVVNYSELRNFGGKFGADDT